MNIATASHLDFNLSYVLFIHVSVHQPLFYSVCLHIYIVYVLLLDSYLWGKITQGIVKQYRNSCTIYAVFLEVQINHSFSEKITFFYCLKGKFLKHKINDIRDVRSWRCCR